MWGKGGGAQFAPISYATDLNHRAIEIKAEADRDMWTGMNIAGQNGMTIHIGNDREHKRCWDYSHRTQ